MLHLQKLRRLWHRAFGHRWEWGGWGTPLDFVKKTGSTVNRCKCGAHTELLVVWNDCYLESGPIYSKDALILIGLEGPKDILA